MKIEDAIKQQKFENNLHKALVNLIYTSNWIAANQSEFFKDYDILPQHYNILRILKGKFPNSSCPGDIKEVMLDKNPDLTRLLDKLVKLGYVDRQLCEENKRKMDITITKKGLDFLNKIHPRMEE